MPVVHSAYRPPSYLFNRHLQTVAPFYWVKPDNTLYQTEYLELSDGDFLELDWVHSGSSKVMLVLHGLEGNSRSHYVQQVARHFSTLGWDVLAMHARSCGRVMNRLPVLYHGGATADVEAVVTHAASKYSALVLVGFSLGANMVINYAARHSLPNHLKAIAAFSVPCDLQSSELQIDRFVHLMYARKFLTKLKNKVRKLESKHPGSVDGHALDQVTSMQAFTARYAASLCGFASVEDYYRSGNCLDALAGARLPTLLVNAQNDPFLSTSCYPTDLARSNQNLVLDIPKKGGHAAFPISKTHSWIPERIEGFLIESGLHM